jgi:hypothetical protein
MGNINRRELNWLFSSFGGIIGNLSNNDLERRQERMHKEKLGPKNVLISDAYVERLNVGFSAKVLPHRDVLEYVSLAMNFVDHSCGFGKSHETVSVYDIPYAKENSSAGINFFRDSKNPERVRLIISDKDDWWSLFQLETNRLLEKIKLDADCDISRVYDEKFMLALANKYSAYFSLLKRTDGGPSSPRIIWCSPAWEYIIEMMFFGMHDGNFVTRMSKDIIHSPFIFTHAKKGWAYLDEHVGELFWSGDISRWDLRWSRWFIITALLHLGSLYKVPEPVLTLIIACNAYGYGLVLDSNGFPVLVSPNGVIKSGTGVFVKIGHYLRLVLNVFLCLMLGLSPDPGLVLGDDSVLAGLTKAQVELCSKWLRALFNVVCKAPSQILSSDGFTICRLIFEHLATRIRPTCWSLVKNAVFVEYPIKDVYTYALRNRTLALYYTQLIENGTWFKFADKLIGILGQETFMPELSSAELMTRSSQLMIDNYYRTEALCASRH